MAGGRSLRQHRVRLELALPSHLFLVAVTNIRKPPPHRGRDRQLTLEEERKLLRTCDKHSNPMLGQTVQLALHTGLRAGEVPALRRS